MEETTVCPSCGKQAEKGWAGDMIFEWQYILCSCGYYEEDGEVKSILPDEVRAKRKWLNWGREN